MTSPKPISLTRVATAPSALDPEPMVVVGGVPVTSTELIAALKALTGYSAGATQTLKNVTGTLTWVNG